MPKNTKRTSDEVATRASSTLRDAGASQVSKRLAASALAQAARGKQTGAEVEDLASRVLRGVKYSDDTKSLAGSLVSQSNKAR